MVPAPPPPPSSDAEVQRSRQCPDLLSLLASVIAFEFHVVLSNTGRPGAETSAKWGEFFPQAVAELTGRELCHDEGQCVGRIHRQPLWGQFFQVKQDPISEATCSELWDLLWEVLHCQARQKLLTHLLPLIKRCCPIYWAHACPVALRRDSICCLSRKQTMKSPRTVLGYVRMLSDIRRTSWGWEEALSIECAALYPLTPHCFFAGYSFSDDPSSNPFVIFSWAKFPLYSQPLDISGKFFYY